MTVNQLFVGGAVLLMLFLLGFISTSFNGFIKKMIANNDNNTIINSLSFIQETVNDVVVYLNTTTVQSLKEMSADGKLTKEEADQVFNEAKSHIKSLIAGDTLELASNIVGDVDKWIDVLIEKFVAMNKK